MSSTHADRDRVERQLDRLTDELTDRFRGVFGESTVYRYVLESYALLEKHATVRTHLVSLTARFATQRLTDGAHASGHTPAATPQVLFVCVRNAGRSQMAAALLEHHASTQLVVRSAGSAPHGGIPPEVITALSEWGISLTTAYPKPLTDDSIRAADVVVTLGCSDACPVLPGRRYRNWEVADPAGRPLQQVRHIRNNLNRRVKQLLNELSD